MKKCFTPRELYDLKPIRVTNDLSHLISVHLPEIDATNLDTDAAENEKQIEKRVLADECADGRRTWTLETIWFRGTPVMVVNSSGRDGDEYHNRYITSKVMLDAMLTYLRGFIGSPEPEAYVEPDQVISGMTEFYNRTLHDFYDIENQRAK